MKLSVPCWPLSHSGIVLGIRGPVCLGHWCGREGVEGAVSEREVSSCVLDIVSERLLFKC